MAESVRSSTLLGGLLTFTTYQPWDDVCLPEGMAYLYGSYYQTGTAWRSRVFAPSSIGGDANGNVIDRLSIGRGLAMTPNLHVGKHAGSKAFVQTSTGAIVEIRNARSDTMIKQSGKILPLIQDFSCYADNKTSKIIFFKGVRSNEGNAKK